MHMGNCVMGATLVHVQCSASVDCNTMFGVYSNGQCYK